MNKITLLLALSGLLLLTACGGGGGNNNTVEIVPTPPASPPVVTVEDEDPLLTENDPELVQIDVLAVLGQDAGLLFADVNLRIQHTINVANDSFQTSGIPVQFNIVHTVQTQYPKEIDSDTALEELTFGLHPELAHIENIRNQHRADLVVFYRRFANDGYCGFGWIGGSNTSGDMSNQSSAGHSVVSIDCPDLTTTHEIGHNMGLIHDSITSPESNGTFPYSRGYGVDGQFVTIMGVARNYGGIARLPLFSTPDHHLCAGEVCGVPNQQDAVRSLLQTYNQVSLYR